MELFLRKAEPKNAAKFLKYCKPAGGETANLTFGGKGAFQDYHIIRPDFAAESTAAAKET